ncbi:unnamed protein product [Closterium sp. Yama58-4]|nr:unnamed protein product [Closterium sp. Yama58-4]
MIMTNFSFCSHFLNPSQSPLPATYTTYRTSPPSSYARVAAAAPRSSKYTVFDAVRDLYSGASKVEDFPPIRVVEQDGLLFSLDNRRLYVFKLYRPTGLLVPVRRVPADKELFQKLTCTGTGDARGKSVEVLTEEEARKLGRVLQLEQHVLKWSVDDIMNDYLLVRKVRLQPALQQHRIFTKRLGVFLCLQCLDLPNLVCFLSFYLHELKRMVRPIPDAFPNVRSYLSAFRWPLVEECRASLKSGLSQLSASTPIPIDIHKVERLDGYVAGVDDYDDEEEGEESGYYMAQKDIFGRELHGEEDIYGGSLFGGARRVRKPVKVHSDTGRFGAVVFEVDRQKLAGDRAAWGAGAGGSVFEQVKLKPTDVVLFSTVAPTDYTDLLRSGVLYLLGVLIPDRNMTKGLPLPEEDVAQGGGGGDGSSLYCKAKIFLPKDSPESRGLEGALVRKKSGKGDGGEEGAHLGCTACVLGTGGVERERGIEERSDDEDGFGGAPDVVPELMQAVGDFCHACGLNQPQRTAILACLRGFLSVAASPNATAYSDSSSPFFSPNIPSSSQFSSFSSPLDDSASRRLLQLVQGPPGTGKTHTISILLSIMLALGVRTLVCAPTNVAAAEVGRRVLHLALSPDPSSHFAGYCRAQQQQCYGWPDRKAFASHGRLRVGDIALVANEERLEIDPELEMILVGSERKESGGQRRTLSCRVGRLIGAVSSLSGWKASFQNLLSFLDTSWEDLNGEFQTELRAEEKRRRREDPSKADVDDEQGEVSRGGSNKKDPKKADPLPTLITHFQKRINLLTQPAMEAAVNLAEDLPSALLPENERLLLLQAFDLMAALCKLVGCAGLTPSVLRTWLEGAGEVVGGERGVGSVVEEASPFPLLLLDEAAQLVEAESVVALQTKGLRYAVLVGDPKQLPATVLSKVAVESHYNRSLFERLQVNGWEVHMLSVQYRMHPEISRFPSHRFYEGRIEDGANVCRPSHCPQHLERLFGPYMFMHVRGKEERDVGKAGEGGSRSIANSVEAAVVLALLKRLSDACKGIAAAAAGVRPTPLKVGLISPYNLQVEYLKRALESQSWPHLVVEVKSADGFQGRERDVIIVTTVRSNGAGTIGFVSDARRWVTGVPHLPLTPFPLSTHLPPFPPFTSPRFPPSLLLSSLLPLPPLSFLFPLVPPPSPPPSPPVRLNVAVTRARYCMWVVGDRDTLQRGDTTWEHLLVDAQQRGCLVEALSDVKLRRVVERRQMELVEVEQLLQPNSGLWDSLIWEATFSVEFQRSMRELRSLDVINAVRRLMGGYRPQRCTRPRHALKDPRYYDIIHVQSVGRYQLIWTVDVSRTTFKQEQHVLKWYGHNNCMSCSFPCALFLPVVCPPHRSTTEQIIRVWDVVEEQHVLKWLRRLEGGLGTYSHESLDRCAHCDDHLARKVQPLQFPKDPGFTWHRAKASSCDVATVSTADEESALERAPVDESVLLMKFYQLSLGSARQLLTAAQGELPFEVNEQEALIVHYPGSLFVLGRSGTGKTTIITHRLLRLERVFLRAMGERDRLGPAVETGKPCWKQMPSSLPTPHLQTQPRGGKMLQQQQQQQQQGEAGEVEELLLSEEAEEKLMGDLPKSLDEVQPDAYPLVLTFKKLLSMVNATLARPFQQDGVKAGGWHGKGATGGGLKSGEYRAQGAGEKGGNSSDDDGSEYSSHDDDDEDEEEEEEDEEEEDEWGPAYHQSHWHRDRAQGTGGARSSNAGYSTTGVLSLPEEVDYDRFESLYWPHFNTSVTRKFDASLVYKEFFSHIKGSLHALRSPRGRLSQEAYVALAHTRTSSFDEAQREDKVRCGPPFQYVYVDEVQDLTQAQIAIFRFLCANTSDGFVFAGDTAQTIARGVDFRFQDIRRLFYELFLGRKVDVVGDAGSEGMEGGGGGGVGSGGAAGGAGEGGSGTEEGHGREKQGRWAGAAAARGKQKLSGKGRRMLEEVGSGAAAASAATLTVGAAQGSDRDRAEQSKGETGGKAVGAAQERSSCTEMPDLFFLSQNFRAHNGIVRLADSVVRVLLHFFPHAVDRLAPDFSLIDGEAPVFLDAKEGDDVVTQLFGKKGAIGGGGCEFGAEQVGCH